MYGILVYNRQPIHNLVDKGTTTGVLIDWTQICQYWILTEEELDEIGDQLQQSSCKFI